MESLVGHDLRVWSFLHLTTLDFYNNRLSLGSVHALVWSQCPRLAYLDLGFNNLSDYTAGLAQAHWPLLTEMRLAGNNNQEVLQLASANWPLLERLYLGDTVVTPGLILLLEILQSVGQQLETMWAS